MSNLLLILILAFAVQMPVSGLRNLPPVAVDDEVIVYGYTDYLEIPVFGNDYLLYHPVSVASSNGSSRPCDQTASKRVSPNRREQFVPGGRTHPLRLCRTPGFG